MTAGLFERILGADFASLPETVRALHAAAGPRRYHGEGEAERGERLLARVCCAAARLPSDHSGSIMVDMLSDATEETWVRRFGAHRMPSRLRFCEQGVEEKLGLLRFVFALDVVENTLHWRVQAVRLLGLPLPRRWFAGVGAREFEHDGRYRFDVWARLPVVGLVVRYRGWLDVTHAAVIDAATLRR